MDNKIEEFIGKAIVELLDNKVGIQLLRKRRVQFGDKKEDLSNGFFNDKPLEFACAMSKPQKDWIPIFLHEFCHFRQWKEQVKVWTDLGKYNAEDKLWDWLDGKENLSKIELKRVAMIVRDMELDCEKRVVKLVNKYGLDCIKVSEYVRAANSYVLFYNVLIKTKKWYITAPYECKQILDTVPDKFLDNYNCLPDRYETMVMKYCFKKKK